jgi:phosphatidylserine/phosphatidylglycerophosphate/cardiolipin synthase-like enzyme
MGIGVRFLLPGERALASMAKLLETHGRSPGAVVELANWHLDHDLALPTGGTLIDLLRSCATAGATIRALVWSGGVPRFTLPRGVAPAGLPSWVWDPILDVVEMRIRDALRRFFHEPAVNRRAVDAINALPGAGAVLDDQTLPLGSHHQKILVVADRWRTTAVIGGVEWNRDRLRSVSPGAPLSDTSVQIDGAAAGDVARAFEQRWRAVSKVPLPARPQIVQQPPGAPGQATVQVGVNYPVGRPLAAIPRAVIGASALIENLLRCCRRFFYLECQYGLGNPQLAQAVRTAFAEGARFGVVVLAGTAVVSDFPEVAFWRHRFWSGFPQADRTLLVFERLGDDGSATGTHAYVHAKLALVDDEAVSIGTLNLSRRSWRHDSEITAVITDAQTQIRRYRADLWDRHLSPLSGAVSPSDAFDLWSALHAGRRTAPRLRPLRMTGPVPPRAVNVARVLPWIPAAHHPLAQKLVDDMLDRAHFEIFDPVGPRGSR